MISETKYWIEDTFQLKLGAQLGSVAFSDGVEERHKIEAILGDADRRDQIGAISGLTAGGGTQIGDALMFSADVSSLPLPKYTNVF